MPLSVNASTRTDPFLFDFEADLGPEPQKATTMENSQHFIKDEHGDQQNGRFVHNDFSGFGGSAGFGIDPSELSMNQQSGLMFSNNNNNIQQFSGSAITDDELLDSLGTSYGFQGGHMGNAFNPNDMDNLPASLGGQNLQLASNMNTMYSHTPEDAPIQSPFVRGFPQFRHHIQTQQIETPSSYNPSPTIMSSSADVHGTSFSDMMMAKNKQSGMQAQPIQNSHMGRHGHQKSLSGTWDGTPGSLSYIESPMSSPGPGSAGHRQISDILGGKHASLPTKVDGMSPSQQSQEAKRRRRRESHNLVERRRRDNINERIQELSFLVPQHRLEDEKVRKHLQNNTPLSPGLHGASPPRATSMLAGGLGRRASGVGATALSIPLEEKDRVPNKGDILNGAVGWTKDLMWALYQKIKQEKEMQQKLESLGQPFPITKNDEMKRMEAELITAVESGVAGTEPFRYSRGHGSGLRVPGFTDLAGAPLNGQADHGGLPINNQQFWHNTGSADMSGSLAFKEEDEFGMDVS
ncbi:hypothetical protein TWF102_001610 [Orbilia oligospora]|uniref:BHLH domain-containing protein n=1 Tax=Orbilia oligospora TaxID=2813651 RepID=A0A7C8N0W7_ORBOL|nr:hypothetical protein TWF102_001610 [Orbilia oligospora]KAF3123751.1 hypothetical protein TWF594_002190 [Orbilia oligospora]KAF3175984.1 hypothetical protein TWF751_003736 [Orbilia oligospora]KAF3247316.1 hypothetical protein TWF217_009717 [Orbilia oligospora]KAF3256211.1 hypothetical protein TWF128_005299 [Orbilia oligospora]